MTKTIKRSMLVLAMATLATTAAYAKHGDHNDRHPHQAPEIDANLAIGGFTLLAGTLTVLRARRSR
jgi:hypothetical protein